MEVNVILYYKWVDVPGHLKHQKSNLRYLPPMTMPEARKNSWNIYYIRREWIMNF